MSRTLPLPPDNHVPAARPREMAKTLPLPSETYPATPGPTPGPTPLPPPHRDWTNHQTPPPVGGRARPDAAASSGSRAARVGAVRADVAAGRIVAPPAAARRSTSPSLRMTGARLPAFPIGLWRSVAVGVAAVLVIGALIVHVGVIPLEVLASWKKPAQLYVASEPEGGVAKLDGVRLLDPTPTKIPVDARSPGPRHRDRVPGLSSRSARASASIARWRCRSCSRSRKRAAPRSRRSPRSARRSARSRGRRSSARQITRCSQPPASRAGRRPGRGAELERHGGGADRRDRARLLGDLREVGRGGRRHPDHRRVLSHALRAAGRVRSSRGAAAAWGARRDGAGDCSRASRFFFDLGSVARGDELHDGRQRHVHPLRAVADLGRAVLGAGAAAALSLARLARPGGRPRGRADPGARARRARRLRRGRGHRDRAAASATRRSRSRSRAAGGR